MSSTDIIFGTLAGVIRIDSDALTSADRDIASMWDEDLGIDTNR